MSAAEALRHARPEAIGIFSRAIEQTADSVMVTDHEGVIEYVNPAFERTTGFSSRAAVGKTPRILHSGVQPREFYQQMWATILAGRPFRTVLTNRRRDGTLFDEDQTITPITDAHGTITHFVSTGRDITQRRRTAEALRRLNQQLEAEATRFAGVLHDEAGQFLTSAHILLAQVCEEGVTPQVRDRLLQVRDHLTRIEERLRSISHEIHPHVVEDLGLPGAVSALIEAFRLRSGIDVRLESVPETRYSLALETVLYRVVQQALNNISRHSGAAHATVSFRSDASGVHCTIRDDGVGFDAAGRCCRPGGGLGLRIMRDRIEALGGTLVVISAPGKGTEVRATITM